MIFIAGIQPKTRRLDSNPRPCPSCGSVQVYLRRVDYYLSLFFVPLVPIRRGTTVLSCENCGATLTESAQPLWSQGTTREHMCPRCGRLVEEGFFYCPHCGTRLQ